MVTAEEHQINGGLGESIAQLLARHLPTPMEFVGVKDVFGESGKPEDLLTKYGLDETDILKALSKLSIEKHLPFLHNKKPYFYS